MTTDLTIRKPDPLPMTFSETMHLGGVLAESGFFKDTRSASQAVAKVLAGRELGFGPMASMTGIYVIEGKISLGANLMAAAVKRSGKYDYRVKRWEDDGCTLEFFERGQSVGISTFDKGDATTAGLLNKDNWRRYPRNQYFARAMSNGTRIFCPDVLGGEVVYTPDEMDVTVDEEGEPIEGDLIITTAKELSHSNGTPTGPIERPPAARVGKSQPQSTAPKPAEPAKPRTAAIAGRITGAVPHSLPSAFMSVLFESKDGPKEINIAYTDAVSGDIWDQAQKDGYIDCMVGEKVGDAYPVLAIARLDPPAGAPDAEPVQGALA